MGFWHRYYRKDLLGWKVTRIANPASGHTPQKDIIWLDSEPSNLDPTGMFYIELDPNLVPPMTFTQDLPGNNTSDAVATYVPLSSAKTFNVAVTGGVPPYTYAWFRRASGTDNPIGTNQPSYSIASYGTGNNGDYFCRVTDSAGQTVESQRERTKPAIALSTNLSANPPAWTAGTSASLTVTVNNATGLAPYTHEWFKDGVSQGAGTSSGTGNITSTLTKASPTEADAGVYWCVSKSANTNPPNTVESVHATVTMNPAA